MHDRAVFARFCVLFATALVGIAMTLGSLSPAQAQGTQIIYDGQLENGWQNWSWATANLSNTSPVYAAYPDSIAVTDSSSGGYGALWLNPGTDISTDGYASVTFWINPGPVASQQLQVIGVSGVNTANNTVSLPNPLVADTWTKETISLSSLGVANISNYAGFWLQNAISGPEATYYIGYVTLDPQSTTANVTVSTTTPLATVPSNPVGINTAVWDGYLTDNNTVPLLQAAGVRMLRYPGGSASDSYHWETNENVQPGDTFTWNSNSSFDPFMTEVSLPLGASQLITVNYGSNDTDTGGGDPAEAAAWVQYANITKSYGIKYWEVGNEVYGNGYYPYADWETDYHDTDQTAADRIGNSALSPVTYGSNVAIYAAAMHAVDPTIKIGAVLQLPGGSDDGLLDWDTNVLAQCGSDIGFVILHWYPEYGTDSDSVLLSDTSQIAAWASQTKALINQYCGANAPNVQIIVDELNSDAGNPGKQMLSTVNALFMADNFETWLENGATNTDYWDLRNGAGNGDSSSSLFGTLQYGDEGALSNGSSTTVGGINYTEPAVDTPFPAYYAIQMIHELANPGDTMIASTSTQTLIASHAVKRADGSVAVLLINKDPDNSYNVTVHIDSFTPTTTLTTYTYGPSTSNITQTSGASGNPVSVTVPAYTMVTLSIPTPSADVPKNTFPRGLQLISIPADFSGQFPSSVLSPFTPMAVWDPVAGKYAVAPTAPADAYRIGHGYWIDVPGNSGATIAAATATVPSASVSVPLNAGWNLVGNPYSVAEPSSAISLEVGSSAAEPLTTAVSSNTIGSTLYTFRAGGKAYSQQDASQSLQPFAGYWMYAATNCTLTYTSPS